MIGLMFTLPSSTDILANIGQTANPVLSDMLPIAYFASALIAAVGIVWLIPKLISSIWK